MYFYNYLFLFYVGVSSLSLWFFPLCFVDLVKAICLGCYHHENLIVTLARIFFDISQLNSVANWVLSLLCWDKGGFYDVRRDWSGTFTFSFGMVLTEIHKIAEHSDTIKATHFQKAIEAVNTIFVLKTDRDMIVWN